ncbi:hypothetical protein BUALT_Bualt10G0077300 [Buddleja alternifolia]|uniref:Uncharacterized protein n=1 Tax=Buddleja alternifolia TaxID=168488 RepID=A0AAV6WXL1_9LAMI|nr:hypothetical protein BUALT_Bualt10G0077300 [Buddleja alternifolia]
MRPRSRSLEKGLSDNEAAGLGNVHYSGHGVGAGKSVKRHPVSTTSLEFAVINSAYVGKKNRYVYAAVGDPMPKIAGVVKVDLSLSTANSGDCTVARRLYGPSCYGGEPCFVAREPDNPAAEEDDGYLVTYMHNENTEESKFLVMQNPLLLKFLLLLSYPKECPMASMESLCRNLTWEKSVTRRSTSTASLQFAAINQAYVIKKNRYVYAAVGAPMRKIAGVVKVDLSLSTATSGECTVARRLYGSGCYGGEPFFVAREPDNPAAEEDDGYLITYMHNENTEESKFLVMDAKSPTLEILAAVKLPQRVPYGFHGIFVPESHLGKL